MPIFSDAFGMLVGGVRRRDGHPNRFSILVIVVE